MSGNSKIEWTGSTWNPIRARLIADVQIPTKADPFRVLPAGTWGYHCERVSPGCGRCYACTMNGRTLPAWGTDLDYTVPNRDQVEIYLDPEELEKPLHWKKPRRIFPCSMTDLFADFVADEMIDRVFAVMALCPQHTFQVLTKRADRMRNYVGISASQTDYFFGAGTTPVRVMAQMNVGAVALKWPLPNVWLGVSVEDQQRTDERVVELLRTPAAIRWVSVEPLLGPVDLERLKTGTVNALDGIDFELIAGPQIPELDWVVIGGESGPGARAMELGWARGIVQQCKTAGVACFVKQLGSVPVIGADENLFAWPDHVIRDVWHGGDKVKLRDSKGGDISEWEPALRVRQFPEVRI